MKFPQIKFRAQKTETASKDTEYTHTSVLRLVSFLVIGFLLLTIGTTIFFVYRSVTSTIGQVESIILLQSELGVEPIDFNTFQKVELGWQAKHTTSTLFTGRDPFHDVPTTTASSSRH